MLFIVSAALAHQPFVVGTANTDAASAFVVEDPDVSIVVYAERTCDAPQLWLETEADPGFPLYVQLGLPVADALAGWRPSLAVIAPGLPEIELGFPLPEGMGGVLLPGSATPTTFDEPFSGTSSWVLVEETVELPEGGPAWVVAWDPAGAAGRLWVATGTVEQFTNDDWARIIDLMDDVRAFHGTDGSRVPAPVACADEEEEAAEAPSSSSGCSTTGGVGASLAALLLAAGLVRRR